MLSSIPSQSSVRFGAVQGRGPALLRNATAWFAGTSAAFLLACGVPWAGGPIKPFLPASGVLGLIGAGAGAGFTNLIQKERIEEAQRRLAARQRIYEAATNNLGRPHDIWHDSRIVAYADPETLEVTLSPSLPRLSIMPGIAKQEQILPKVWDATPRSEALKNAQQGLDEAANELRKTKSWWR
jgi:hypothetical protein